MKKVTIVIQDEELVRMLSQLLRFDADFTVETVHENGAPQKPTRTIHRGPGGKTCSELVLDAVKDGSKTKSYLKSVITDQGYSEGTLNPTLSKLVRGKEVMVSGDLVYIYPKVGPQTP